MSECRSSSHEFAGTGPLRHEMPSEPFANVVSDSAGSPGTLCLYRTRVRLVAGRFSAEHERLCEPGAMSTLPEHRAQAVAALSGGDFVGPGG